MGARLLPAGPAGADGHVQKQIDAALDLGQGVVDLEYAGIDTSRIRSHTEALI